MPKQIKNSFALKKLSFFHLNFSEKLSKDSCFCALCHHIPSLLEPLQTSNPSCKAFLIPLFHWSISHGRSNLELELRQLGSQYTSIHHLEHLGTSVSAYHSQRTTVSSLHLQQGWFSILLFDEIMICFMKILLCWLQCNLNRGKWLIIERVTSILSLVAKYVFACFSIVSID